MNSQCLLSEFNQGVVTLTLNRPTALNALNLELKSALAKEIADLAVRQEVRAVVITGAGRAFCAGGDIKEMDSSRSPAEIRDRLAALHRMVFAPLAAIEKPVIAAVNGPAFGAGLSLALACDIVISADTAKFGLAFTLRGLVPDAGAAYRLVRLMGLGRVKDLAFTGRIFGAEEACNFGIVQKVVGADDLAVEVQNYAATLALGATRAIGLTKRLLDLAPHSSLESMTEHEIGAVIQAIGTSDHAEALKAFTEKRPANFTGR